MYSLREHTEFITREITRALGIPREIVTSPLVASGWVAPGCGTHSGRTLRGETKQRLLLEGPSEPQP